MVNAVTTSLPFLADPSTIRRTLEECKGSVNDAVSKLLDAEEGGSLSTQESSSVEREPDSDDEDLDMPNKRRDRRMSRATRNKTRDPDHRQALSKLATHNSSQESVASAESEASSFEDTSRQGSIITTDADVIEIKQENSMPPETVSKPTIRIKLNPPKPPDRSHSSVQHRQSYAARMTARDRKDIKKQAQKAARRERQQAATKGHSTSTAIKSGLTLRSKGITRTPPIESNFVTLYI